ncbi:MAG: glutathione S-transferase family protein [Beijerinckiaceae bacterium]
MLTIWGRTNSVNVQKALAALEEAGVAYQRVDAGLAFGVVNTPGYRAMNPNGLVPTIDDDGFVLWESNSIIRYVCAKYAPRLYPPDPQARASAERWMDWQLTTLLDPVNAIFRPLVRKMGAPDADAIEKARLECVRNFSIMDAVLARQPWMTGAEFGIADCCLAPITHRWLHLPVDRSAAPGLQAWYARIRERPCGKILELPLS